MRKDIPGLKFLLYAAALMWAVQVINMFSGYQLAGLAIVPREISHLWGIIFAPFLHWSLGHIIANTLPFLLLGFFVHKAKQLVFVTLFVWFVGGLLVWLFGRDANHAGASGLIMGYFGFLISHAFFTRSLRAIVISVITFAFYGGIFFTLLDFRSHISFEGHIFGFLSGIVAAWMVGKEKPQAEQTSY